MEVVTPIYETIKVKSILLESLSQQLTDKVDKAGLDKVLSQFRSRLHQMILQLTEHEVNIEILMQGSESIRTNVLGSLSAIQNLETYLNELLNSKFLPQLYMISKSKIKAKIQSMSVPLFQVLNTLIISIGIELIKNKLGCEYLYMYIYISTD